MRALLKRHGDNLAGALLFVAIGLRFGYWQWHPSLLSASLFWTVALTGLALHVVTAPSRHRVVARAAICLGASLNAVVVLANDGFMPVTSNHTYSVWVASNETAQRLLFLSDKYAGFSVGDFVIISGFVVLLMCWLVRRATR